MVNFDEAYFIIVARTFSSIAKELFLHPISFFHGSFLSDLAANYGNVYTAARPSYVLASSFLALFLPATVASRLISLFSGYVLIIFFYRLLKFYVEDKKTRTILTLLPAMSPLLLVYSRLGLSQIFSAAFLTVSTYYLLSYYRLGKRGDLIKFGFAAAVLFMSHYNVVFLVFFLLLYGVWSLKKHGVKVKDWSLFAISFLALPFLWEMITQVASAVAGDRLGSGKVLSYSGEFLAQLAKAQVSEETPFGQLLYYPKLFILTEGVSIALLLIIGLFLLLRRAKKIEYQVIIVPLIFSLLIFFAAPLKFPRNLISVWPSLYLAVAIAVSWIGMFLTKGRGNGVARVLSLLIVVLVSAPHFMSYPQYLAINTGNDKAALYVKEHYDPQNTLILSWSTAIWRVYLPGYASEQLAEPDEWKKLLSQRSNVLVIDDFFTSILDPKKEQDVADKKLVFDQESEIFKARPIILDLIYKSPDVIDKMFDDNAQSHISIFELDGKSWD